jgi:WD40 repeat protein
MNRWKKRIRKRFNPLNICIESIRGDETTEKNLAKKENTYNISHNFSFIHLVKMWRWIVLLMLWERAHSWCYSHNLDVGSKVQCLDYSPDGSKIVVGLESENVRIYNSVTRAQVANYRRWGYKATTCRYSPDGTKIAVGYEDNDIKIVKGDIGYWEMYTVNTGHGKVYGVDFSSDSSKLLTCGDNGRFRVFNVQSSYSSIGGNFNIG